jgi:anti-sigma factor RsiW
MKEETAIQLEAWFDGELTEEEATRIKAQLESDPELQAHLKNLKAARQAMAGIPEAAVDVDAAWSAVEERLDRPARIDSRKVVSFPRMVATVAAILVLGMALWMPMRNMGGSTEGLDGLADESVVQMVETDLENATPIVYLDQPSGWTVVWVMEEESES